MRRKVFSPKEIAALDSLTDVDDFRAKALSLIHTIDVGCEIQEAHAVVVYGARSSAEQWRIFAIGRVRDESGIWHRIPGQKIYTNSTPSQSAHCFGAAADIALVSDASGAWLDGADPLWDWYADQARELGLQPGREWTREFGPYGDAAHVEVPQWKQFAARGDLVLVEESHG